MNSYSPTTTGYPDDAPTKLMRALAESIRTAYPAPGTPRDLGTDVPATPAQDESAERFFLPVLGDLLKVFVQAAPGIVQGVMQNNRDIFGSSVRDVEFAERGFLDVVKVVLPHLPKMADAVIGAFAGQRDVAPPESEEDLRERWFLPLLTTVLPTVIPAVSQLVSTLSQGRDLSAAPITDPNVAPRWFGPIVTGIVSALSSALPSIVATFTGPRPQ